MTKAVKAPRSANSSTIQRSKSVAAAFASEVDTWRLRHVMLEQDPEWLGVGFGVPFFEIRERLADIRQCLVLFLRREPHEHRLGDWREARQHRRARLVVARPIEFRAHDGERTGDRDLLAFRGGRGLGERAHEIEPAVGEGALVLDGLEARGDLAAEIGFGRFGLGRGLFQLIEKNGGGGDHRALREGGGREWESNPPRTGSRPLPDLKSGRPTGDASLPELGIAAAGGSAAAWRNRSSRCLLSRRRSPRRMVTPWRSKYSRI